MAEITSDISSFDEKTQRVLIELEKTQHEFWNIDRNTGYFLYNEILKHNSSSGLEIGTSNGYSGIWLASALKKNNGTLSTIEFWDKRQSIAIKNFEICSVSNVVKPYCGSAFAILENMQTELKSNEFKKFDFVFIDANKKEYLKYFQLLEPLLACGAYIYADNMHSHEEKVRPFLEEIKTMENYTVELLELGTGVLKAYKKN